MTVGELRELLEEFDDNTEVRLAIQPNYAMEHSLSQVVAVPVTSADGDEDAEEDGDQQEGKAANPDNDEQAVIVYLAEGEWLGYLSGQAARELGWRG